MFRRVPRQSRFWGRFSTATLFAVAIASFTGVCRAQSRPTGPCDIFASATPCVAAYSTTRAMFSSYNGSLYQVERSSDSSTENIGINANGFANAAAQDSFCAGTTCTITKLYDQTSNHNDLTLAPPGGAASGAGPSGYDLPVFASALPVTAGGQKVYGMYFQSGMGYRNDATTGIAVKGKPEGVYMVTSGAHVNGGCCFDFGNAETNNLDNGAGHMDAINIICSGNPCTPVVGLDMENGIYGSLSAGNGIPFVTAMGSNDGQRSYTIYQGNAQSGALTTTGSTALPSGYAPMQQEGAIILGIGGDNSNTTIGSFYEGAMTNGAPSSSVMSSVQANIVSAGYTGMLPYHDGFAGGTATGWTTYNGSWSVSGNTYVNSSDDTGGDKAITGSTAWGNYTLQGDVQVTNSGGNSGLLFRVTNPGTGADSLDGYFVGVDTGGFMVLGRESYGWTELQTASIPGGVTTGTWYHLTAQVNGCTFTVSAQPVGSTTVTSFTYTDSGCSYTAGAVGVRTYNSAAKWRNINVTTGVTATAPYYAPFASGSGPSGFTTYGGSWSLSSENYIDSTVDTQGDKSVGGPSASSNYTVTGDVEVTTSGGNSGFLLRASNPALGADSLDGYYVGVDSSGAMVIGKESYGWTQLAAAPLNASPSNTWYHLTAQVVGCQIRLTAQPVNSTTSANDVAVTDCSYSSGQPGVRTYDTSAQWRYLSVMPN